MAQNRGAELLTISEAAAILGVPDEHICKMIADSSVKVTMHGDEPLLHSDDLERLCRAPREREASLIRRLLPWSIGATAIAIIVGSMMPGVGVGQYDKEGHWLAYMILSCQITYFLPGLKKALLGNALALALGTLLEYTQGFLAWRHFSYEDLGANYLGVISGMILGSLLVGRKAGKF